MFAVIVALVGVSAPQPAGVDAPVWATPWSATAGVPSGTVGLAWNSYATTIVNDGGADFGWHFSDTNTTLTGISGYNGTYYNGPGYSQTSAQGGADKAVRFYGGQYAKVPTNNQYSMNNNQAYSLEVIFKLESLSNSDNPRLLSHSDLGSGNGGWEMGYNGSQDPNAGQVSCSRYAGGSATIIGSNGYQLPVGQYVHLVCTYDGSTLRFYWNGELRSSNGSGNAIQENGKDLFFGSLGGTTAYANGEFDEVALYWNALSQREVKSHYYAMLAKLP